MSEDLPGLKLLLSYDVRPESANEYRQFVLQQYIPEMQNMGLQISEAWHTAYGEYPLRMAAFVTEDLETLQDMLDSDRWQDLETELQSYVRNYSRSVVEYRQGFQFIRS